MYKNVLMHSFFRYSPENPDMLTTLGLLYMQVCIHRKKSSQYSGLLIDNFVLNLKIPAYDSCVNF